MIKRATVEDVARLIGINDTIIECFAGDRGEVIQFLCQCLEQENPNVAVWINDDNGINAYIVAINNVQPPVADYVFIPYAYCKAGSAIGTEIFRAVTEWARELGARAIQMATKLPEHFARYGFKESEFKLMEFDLNG